MKILRIIARLNVGGPARHVVWLTEALNDSEFETKLIAGSVPEGEEDMAYFASEHGVEPRFLKEMSRELSPKDAVSLSKILRIIKAEKPDIIHTHTAKAGTVGRAAAFVYKWFTPATLIGRPRRVRVVHTFHGHVFHSYYGKTKTRIFILIEQLLARFATDKIIVLTAQQLREIHEQTGVGRREQFEIVPLGIDLSHRAFSEVNREEFRKELNATCDEILIGFVGRLTEIKNVAMLLNAAAAYFAQKDVPETKFIIVGDGHLREELEALSSKLGLGERVIFLGNRDDIERVYSGLDVVALTSLNEGTPLSLIEAMAASKAVASTAVGGVTDLVGNETSQRDGFSVCERGISVESGNADGFANGLIYLAKNEKLRIDLGEKGHQFAVQNYDKERLIEDIRSLYTRLLAN